MDAFAADRINAEWEDRVVGFAVLCHDLGKPATTRFEDGRLRSKNHDVAGEAPSRSFLARLTAEQRLMDEVVALVTTHLRPMELYNSKAGDSAIRRLAAKVVRIDRLVRVALADQKGRPPMPFDDFLAGEWLLERARELEIRNQAPKPLVLGRHLIEMGKKPGPNFKVLLDQCYEAQLDGKFTTLEDGLAFCRQLLLR
jgi:tRNA nucleotidyltransferase (CCA-adding enzyme)